MSNEEVSILSRNLWGDVLAEMSRRLSKPSYDTWIAPLSGEVFEDGKLIITAQNDLSKEWIQSRYKQELLDVLKTLTGQNYKIKVTSVGESKPLPKTRMNNEQAIGYMLLACKEVNFPIEAVNQLHVSMLSQFDFYTPEEAEKGIEWFSKTGKE
ncbi:chromosomal replication initiation ATPase DnaA [Bacillus tianshenii]|uniref:Chromosomal replication initiation ATPase DnaA n=1 Tax=Sutcliffiella tianshenii TaxID=1463404 RepID=A0ABS2NZC6_9BACI|nr:DnaA N-terminal domain-containing protein [Bacillus tianshenii]MBM7620010.1 chromosomal replication initiation ATPase DnaA [Bacillus tianshenii]